MLKPIKRFGAIVAASSLILVGCSDAQSGASKSEEAKGSFTITDVAGREVSLDKAPERVVLGEGRGVFATGILNKDEPLEHVVALGSDLKSATPDYYKHFEEQFPKVKDLPEIGSVKKGDVTVENLVSLDADLLLLTMDQFDAAKTTGLDKQMDAAGLKYAMIDFRQHPIENTTRSMEIFGKVFGHEDKAEEFNEQWQKVVDDVKEKAAKGEGKRTFLWRAAGISDCCGTWNNANIGELINFAGGKNLGDEVLDAQSGAVTPEKVLEMQPEAIIATGGDWGSKVGKDGAVGYIALGYDIDQAMAQASVDKAAELQPGFEQLKAFEDGNFHAMWHQFYNSPFNYVALLQIAKWVNPEHFKDVDVDAAWSEAQEKFSPIGDEGTFFSTAKATK